MSGRSSGKGRFGARPRGQWAIPDQLQVLASNQIVPGTAGSACILGGAIPDYFEHSAPHASVAFLLAGDALIERRSASRSQVFQARIGVFSISPSRSGEAFRSEGYHETLNLGIDESVLQSIAEREFDYRGSGVNLLSVGLADTPEIVAIGDALARLVRAPRPGGRLLAESLWYQLVIELLWKRSTLAHASAVESEIRPLSGDRMARVIEYLRESLAENIGLNELADLVGLSPNYFVTAFKKATGKTPHRYRMEMRLTRACQLLRDPGRSIAAVAIDSGFGSQSHLTTTFRREMGTTPGEYRRSLRGGD